MSDKIISGEDKADINFQSALGWLAAAAVSIATLASFA
jgi:hypothetical protein